jgi:hypothetical protein
LRSAGSEIRHRSPPAAEQFFVTAERAISFHHVKPAA